MNIPVNLKYTKDHEWISIEGDIATVGITDFAQGELGDIVYVEIEKIGENFLKEELEVKISFYEEKPISIELPNQVTCKIESTDVALKGQTVSSSYKPALLDNGINIQVPPFIETGDEIIIDTRSIEYIKKV